MTTLAHLRCWNHGGREAAVVCPECRRYFCRECATEHQGRMMCTACVTALSSTQQRARTGVTLWIGLAVGGVLLAWLAYYNLGLLLARIPSEFHGGAR